MNFRPMLSGSITFGLGILFGLTSSRAQTTLQFTDFQRLTNGELFLRLSVPAAGNYRIDAAAEVPRWFPLVTLQGQPGSVSIQHTDSAGPYVTSRFYRAEQLSGSDSVAGDHLVTNDGDIILHPINHGTLVMQWRTHMIYVDPTGGTTPYRSLPRAHVVLLTHGHGDHFDQNTINGIKDTTAVILAPRAVQQVMTVTLRNITTVMTNGASTNVLGIGIEAVPAYNLTTSNHPKGVGNGYVLTIGGKRIYIAGDTEDIPEMRALRDIDAAFVCMNLPYTMSVDKAASAVRQFRPKVVYPYHYSGSDVNRFKRLVGTDLGIEVRLRKWY